MPEYFNLIDDELWADWPEPQIDGPIVPLGPTYWQRYSEWQRRPHYPCSASLVDKLRGSGKDRYELNVDFEIKLIDPVGMENDNTGRPTAVLIDKEEDRRQWFIDRIGNTVFRNKTTCYCNSCASAYNNGLLIHDRQHADYLCECEGEINVEGGHLRYFDTIEQRDEYEQQLETLKNK